MSPRTDYVERTMIPVSKLAAWLLKVMLAIAPADVTAAASHETVEQTTERYADIAVAIAQVATEEDPLFPDDDNRFKTAAVMLSTALYESAYFNRAVDLGSRRGDGGASWCLMQINLGGRRIVPEDDLFSFSEGVSGWSGRDLASDRHKCFLVGQRFLKLSLRQCKFVPERFRLSAYISGNCSGAQWHSASRMHLARKIEHMLWDFWAEDTMPIPWCPADQLVCQEE